MFSMSPYGSCAATTAGSNLFNGYNSTFASNPGQAVITALTNSFTDPNIRIDGPQALSRFLKEAASSLDSNNPSIFGSDLQDGIAGNSGFNGQMIQMPSGQQSGMPIYGNASVSSNGMTNGGPSDPNVMAALGQLLSSNFTPSALKTTIGQNFSSYLSNPGLLLAGLVNDFTKDGQINFM